MLYSKKYFDNNDINMEENTINIILANSPVKNGNRGCVALSITMMSLIDEVMKNAGVMYRLFLPDSQYRDQEKHEYKINDKVVVFEDCNYTKGLFIKDEVKIIAKALIGENKAKKIFKNADYILDIGQGDSFTDIYGEYRFKLIDRIHVLARKYNKPYCILPQTIGPFKDKIIKEKALESIRKAQMCMTRDKQSYNYVIKNVPEQQKIAEYIDVAFFMPYEKIEQESGYTHVGLNISSLLWHGGYTRDNQFGLKCDYKKLVKEIINYFLSLKNTKVHLIPHVVEGERGIENDYEVSYEIWREYNNANLVLAPFALGPIEIKSYIAGMDFFMGARMHATIGAFSSGVPVVPMAYSRKFNGLFVDTLQYDAMVDMKTMNNNLILSEITKNFANRSNLKEMINERMTGIVAERRKMLVEDLNTFFNL